jgi:hypothetical protein
MHPHSRAIWVFGVTLACAGCSDGVPIVLESSRVPAPDSDWVATVERVDNGLGFGQGALYDEIHVAKAGTEIDNHGDPSHSGIFYVMEETDADLRATASWAGPRRLVISYDARRSPGRMLRQAGDVTIDYEPTRPPTSKEETP